MGQPAVTFLRTPSHERAALARHRRGVVGNDIRDTELQGDPGVIQSGAKGKGVEMDHIRPPIQ
jgi:hypothetical protein